jgi:hypothetical protein
VGHCSVHKFVSGTLVGRRFATFRDTWTTHPTVLTACLSARDVTTPISRPPPVQVRTHTLDAALGTTKGHLMIYMIYML